MVWASGNKGPSTVDVELGNREPLVFFFYGPTEKVVCLQQAGDSLGSSPESQPEEACFSPPKLAIVGSEIQAWLLRLPVSFQESACLDFGSIYRMDISLLSRRKFDLDYYCKISTRL